MKKGFTGIQISQILNRQQAIKQRACAAMAGGGMDWQSSGESLARSPARESSKADCQ